MLCPLLLPICPFAKATEGQIVSWGSWAGSDTDYWEKKWFTAKLLAVLLICMRVLYIWQAFNKI